MFLFSKQVFVEIFSEVIYCVFTIMGNILTKLLWSLKLYQGAIMFLILITPLEKYDYLSQKQFWQHTHAISPEE